MPASPRKRTRRAADPLKPIRRLLEETFNGPALGLDALCQLQAAAQIMGYVRPEERTAEAEFLAGTAGSLRAVQLRQLIWRAAAQIAGNVECAEEALASGDRPAMFRAWRRRREMVEMGLELIEMFPEGTRDFLPCLTVMDPEPIGTATGTRPVSQPSKTGQ